MVGRAAYNKYVNILAQFIWALYQSPFILFDPLSILVSPWQTLGLVDTAVYGVPSSGLTRRQVPRNIQLLSCFVSQTCQFADEKTFWCLLSVGQVLEQYQVYADSVLGTQGNGRPNVRDLVKVSSRLCVKTNTSLVCELKKCYNSLQPLLNIFHSENGNSLWKRRADAAFKECKVSSSMQVWYFRW